MASLLDDSQWRWILSVSVGRRIHLGVSEHIRWIQPERKICGELDMWIQVCLDLDTHPVCLGTCEDKQRVALTLLEELEERS